MKKRKIPIAILLAVLLILGNIYMNDTECDAKARLNKSSVKIQVGQSCQLKLKGSRKKTVWSSAKKRIATVTKKGLVKGKGVGKTTIMAKVGKKKLSCKVTVIQKESSPTNTPSHISPTPTPGGTADSNKTENMSLKKLAEGCEVKVEKLPYQGDLLFTVTNTNKEMVSCINISCTLKNSANEVVDKDVFTLYAIPAGKSRQYLVRQSLHENLELDNSSLDAKNTEITEKAVDTLDFKVGDVTSQIHVNLDTSLNGALYCNVKNNSSYSVKGVVVLYFYDANGNLLDADFYTKSWLYMSAGGSRSIWVPLSDNLSYAKIDYGIQMYSVDYS